MIKRARITGPKSQSTMSRLPQLKRRGGIVQ
jgi:hypothetical protein